MAGFGANFNPLSMLMGKPSEITGVNRFNPGQMNAQQGLMQLGQQGLQNPSQGFAPIAQHARSQFDQQTVPSISERFTSLGGQRGSNALSSPAFASQMGQAGAGLEEALASMEAQYGLQNQSNFMNMMQMGMQPQYDNFQTAGTTGALENYLPTLLENYTKSQSSSFGNQFQQVQPQKNNTHKILALLANLGMHVGSAYATGGATAIPSALSLYQQYK